MVFRVFKPKTPYPPSPSIFSLHSITEEPSTGFAVSMLNSTGQVRLVLDGKTADVDLMSAKVR